MANNESLHDNDLPDGTVEIMSSIARPIDNDIGTTTNKIKTMATSPGIRNNDVNAGSRLSTKCAAHTGNDVPGAQKI